MQISGAVKYPVLEVKWQQKLWLWHVITKAGVSTAEVLRACQEISRIRASTSPANSH